MTGGFGGVTWDLAFLAPTRRHGANAVTRNLRRSTIALDAAARTRNQRAVAPAVQALGFGNEVDDVVVLRTLPEARGVFDQLAGAGYASTRGGVA